MKSKKLRIFVAMPGDSMGENADWDAPDRIKANFYEEIGKKAADKLSNEVEIIIEKDKVKAGPIHASMFKEALESDIYIADLSGNNANVYLELGVRWALTDGVTILVSQNVKDVLFNVSSSRTIPYGKDPDLLNESINEVVAAIIEGLKETSENSNYCDSPVREKSDLVTYSRSAIENIKQENKILKSQRGDDLLNAARKASTSIEKLNLLREVVSINPNRADAFYNLGVELRNQADYLESIDALKKSISLDNNNYDAYRELGISYGKNEYDELSIEAFKKSILLNHADAETLRNYGGALRRWAFRGFPAVVDWKTLQDAQNSYKDSVEIEKYNTYAKMNVAKIELQLSKHDSSRAVLAEKYFKEVISLCEFEVSQEPTNHWAVFDLSDAYLFSGRYKEALEKYDEGIKLIEKEHRKSTISSVLSPLVEMQELDVMQGSGVRALSDVIDFLNKSIT